MLTWRVDGRDKHSRSLGIISFMIPSVSPAYAPLLGYHDSWLVLGEYPLLHIWYVVVMQVDLNKLNTRQMQQHSKILRFDGRGI